MNKFIYRILITITIGFLISYPLSLGAINGLGIMVCLYILISFIAEMGKGIPIRELMAFIVFLQLFISPLIVYQYFDNQASFKMYVPQKLYMSYILPALIAFTLGLFIKRTNEKSILVNLKQQSLDHYAGRGKALVVIGFLASLMRFNVPSSLFFIFYLLSLIKFVGVFLLMFSKVKFRWVWVIAVFVEFSLNIIRGGVFYDLFVWLGFLFILIQLRVKQSFLSKLILITSGVIVVYFVQTVKADYRKVIWEDSIETNVSREEIFLEVASNKLDQTEALGETSNFDKFISRLNTGWILSKVMEHTPLRQPFVDGELLKQDLINVFLPRILFPDKAKTGGKQNQEKFRKFTGRVLVEDTTMRIGAFADAYVNFGVVGGWICMFCLGALFNLVLSLLYRLANYNITFVFWIPLIFSYAVRMSDFQVILNFTFKALIFMIFVNLVFFYRKNNHAHIT